MRNIQLLFLLLLSLVAGGAQGSPTWPMPHPAPAARGIAATVRAPAPQAAVQSLPKWVRAVAQYHSAIFKVVPGQPWPTDLKLLKVYSYYGDGRPLSIEAACKEIAATGYYQDWAKVAVEDVTALVPAIGWRWDDAKKPRTDKLGAYLWGARAVALRDTTIEGYGALDWSGAGAVSVDSDSTFERVAFQGNAAAGLRLLGKGNVVRDCTFRNNVLRASDMGQLYQAGRGKGGGLLVERCHFGDNLESVPPIPAWDGKTYWRRWGIHIDDGASDVVVKDCTFTNLDGAIDVNGGTNILIKGCVFTNCRLDLEVVGNGTLTFVDCWFDGKRTPSRTRISGKPKLIDGVADASPMKAEAFLGRYAYLL